MKRWWISLQTPTTFHQMQYLWDYKMVWCRTTHHNPTWKNIWKWNKPHDISQLQPLQNRDKSFVLVFTLARRRRGDRNLVPRPVHRVEGRPRYVNISKTTQLCNLQKMDRAKLHFARHRLSFPRAAEIMKNNFC